MLSRCVRSTMSDKIVIPCSECGSNMSVPNTAAGKKVRCPKCKTVVAIPGGSSHASIDAASDISVAEPQLRRARRISEPVPPTPPEKPAQPEKSATLKARQTREKAAPAEDDWLDDDVSSSGSGGSEWDSYGNPAQTPQGLPPRGKRKKTGGSTPSLRGTGNEAPDAYSRPSRSGTNGSVVTGILMMVGAAVWFFGGLAVGVIFFYPPVLFVLGFIALVKGIMSAE